MSTPIHTVTCFEIAPVEAAAVATALSAWAEAARKSEAIPQLQLLRRTAPAHHFAIVASWRDRAHYDTAREGGGGTALRKVIGQHLVCGIDTRFHDNLIGGPDAGRGSGTVEVVTHVDVPPPNKDACIALLGTQVAATRGSPGCARLEVLQQADRPNHFSVLESWAGEAAYAAHIVAAHTREFRMALTPLSGALYDERIYSRLS